MKNINILFLVFLIFGSLISISLSSKLRKYDSLNNENFLEKSNEEEFSSEGLFGTSCAEGCGTACEVGCGTECEADCGADCDSGCGKACAAGCGSSCATNC